MKIDTNEVEKSEELQLSCRLQQLEESLALKPVNLTTFRKLQRKELQEDKNHVKSLTRTDRKGYSLSRSKDGNQV